MFSNKREEKDPQSRTLIRLLQDIYPDGFESDATLLEPFKATIKLNASIEEHAKWAADAFYYQPMKTDARTEEEKEAGIAKLHHGISHASRVAAYIPALVNLHRRFGDKDYAGFTDEDIKLMQIAGLFHDVARRA